ncbi:uncharacterized protein PAC_18951 [Phialocephala subalpina]|uniref:Xylanolytic transcriptional activator regulatory domain-containing protein n=1 Tax=Phialocephala subalpina TaxID=576137 RepID=A0A1L7XVP5_9HELO|nr:uncharacterized protein PAC_18951 [Phialocephala subalpina]
MPGQTQTDSPDIETDKRGRKRKARSKYTQQACAAAASHVRDVLKGNFPVPITGLETTWKTKWLVRRKIGTNDIYMGDESAPRKRRQSSFTRTASEALEASSASLDSLSANDTDTFELGDCWLDSRIKQPLSLQAKLTTLRKTLSLQPPATPLPSPAVISQESATAAAHILELPSPLQLYQLLRVFFREFNAYFPCLHQNSFENQLLTILKSQRYSDSHHSIGVRGKDSCSLALLCAVLALAEFVNPEDKPEERVSQKRVPPRGWNWHLKSRHLLQIFRSSTIQNIDAARTHTLESMYLVHTEKLGESCESIALAVVVAQAIGLNDQSTWMISCPTERAARKLLWWIIYYQDRRVAEKLGRAYTIRDIEVDVDDFAANMVPGDTPTCDERVLMYMQTLVDWGRAWAKIWDAFFSPSARDLGNRHAIEALDEHVLGLQAKLPSCLQYDRHVLSARPGDLAYEDESYSRYRILCHTRLNLLRLVIRHNPLLYSQDDSITTSICASTARSTIGSLCAYITAHRRVHQLGLFVTASLVECICHLVSTLVANPDLRTQVCGDNDDGGSDGLVAAKNLLQLMSPRCGGAVRALRIVEPLVSAVEDLSRNDLAQLMQYDLGVHFHNLKNSSDPEGVPAPELWKFLSYESSDDNSWMESLMTASTSDWVV